MIAILIFFCVHWFFSLFFHTFFLHRYASHQMYTTSKGWERVFYFATWFFQGSSYLVPRAYGVMHRMHHEYSDTEHDPHSPHFFKDVWSMMVRTRQIYNDILNRKNVPDAKFTDEPLPEWDAMDRVGDHILTRLAFAFSYIGFYVAFAPSFWWYLLLPIHFLMGPVQGAVVNWCGHKYGYSNFNNGDHSRNSSPWGIILLGELFQNNHHKFKDSPNFAKKWFELDPTYPVMKVMNWVGIIKLKSARVKRATFKAAA
ncbi:acyl-CoA desaturase [Chitinophaga sp. GbtcB8]|uniref:acyl-CoA desaturase n=1 Tax=Chitinophaga sp. GbtcB8 TaxID=2824753 RepID=UPI001C2FA911|nr:acyl-CoA desaturase [Chitinophaga sp. GbtcB8]